MKEGDYKPQTFAAMFDAGEAGGGKGDPNKPYWEKTPQDYEALLKKDYGPYYQGQVIRTNEDGTESPLEAFSFSVFLDDYSDVKEYDSNRNHALFMLPLAVRAGYRLTEPTILASTPYVASETKKPLSLLWLLLEKKDEILQELALPSEEISGLRKYIDASIAVFRNPLVVSSADVDETTYNNPHNTLPKLTSLLSFHKPVNENGQDIGTQEDIATSNIISMQAWVKEHKKGPQTGK